MGLVPDPNEIVGRFGDEYEKLMWLTLMSPWGETEDVTPAPEVPKPPAGKKKARSKPEEAEAPVPKRFRNL